MSKSQAAPTLSCTEVYAAVRESAEEIRNDDHAVVPSMSPGDNVRQGDVYITFLGDHKPKEQGPYEGRQLAPGSTQGSRHIIAGDKGVRLYTPDEQDAVRALNKVVPATRKFPQLVGPVVEATEPFCVTHPEHGDRTLQAGTYLVTYQRDFAEELRRQQD